MDIDKITEEIWEDWEQETATAAEETTGETIPETETKQYERKTVSWEELEKKPPNLVVSEMCLLGNILKNLDLLTEYEGVLQVEDFYDNATKEFYLFLGDYHRRFGSEYKELFANAAYTEYKKSHKEFRQLFPSVTFPQVLGSIRDLGLENEPADSDAFRRVKACSFMRKLNASGFSTDSFMKENKYLSMTTADMLDTYCAKLDSLAEHVEIDTSEEFSGDVVERARKFLETPEFGIPAPFEFINEQMHGLCPNDLTMIGGLTNTGKGRLLMFLLVYLVCVEKQKVYLISNEMTSTDLFKAMVCTLANMPQLRELHGKNVQICQNDIVQMRFPDANGEVMEQREDESPEDYEQRLLKDSPTYNDYVHILTWFQDNYADSFHFVSAMDDYSDKRIRAEIRGAERMGCSIVAYDTM